MTQYVLEREVPFLKVRPLKDSDYHELIVEWGRKHAVYGDGFMRPDGFVAWWTKVSGLFGEARVGVSVTCSPVVQIKMWTLALYHAKNDWCGATPKLYGFLTKEQVRAAGAAGCMMSSHVTSCVKCLNRWPLR